MRLKYSFEIMEIDDQVVAVPVGDNANELHGIIRFNSSGAEILKLLQEEKSEAEIVSELSGKYDSSGSEIQAYVSEFVNQLKEAGLLV